MMRTLIFSFIIIMAFPTASSASIYDEYIGVRSMGMGGAHRGVGTSNDTLYLNPAGMAVATRYGVETAYQYS
ncbi:hypothetical protein KAI87_08980, partial [Myxococcota bacterium]|nr:hypothetical protein [Myxococcota bacterium]